MLNTKLLQSVGGCRQTLEILNTQPNPFPITKPHRRGVGGGNLASSAHWRGPLFLFAEGPRVCKVEEGSIHFRPLLNHCGMSGPAAQGKVD